MCYLRGGYVYSRGLFLPNLPGATFIQGGTFIPDSRVESSSRSNLILHIIQFTNELLAMTCSFSVNASITGTIK